MKYSSNIYPTFHLDKNENKLEELNRLLNRLDFIAGKLINFDKTSRFELIRRVSLFHMRFHEESLNFQNVDTRLQGLMKKNRPIIVIINPLLFLSTTNECTSNTLIVLLEISICYMFSFRWSLIKDKKTYQSIDVSDINKLVILL